MAKNQKKIIAAAVLFLGAMSASTAQAIVFTNPLTNNPGPGGKTLDQLITSVMGFLFWLAITICPVLVIWGAFNIATAGGDENKIQTGKKFITSAVVGFLVIGTANVIKAVILDIAGIK